jgi:hypothetical protein
MQTRQNFPEAHHPFEPKHINLCGIGTTTGPDMSTILGAVSMAYN